VTNPSWQVRLPQVLVDLIRSEESSTPATLRLIQGKASMEQLASEVPFEPATIRAPIALDALRVTSRPAPIAAPRVVTNVPAANPAPAPAPALLATALSTTPYKAAPSLPDAKSLFGEILDWMYAPLVLIWPLTIALTFIVARSLADGPFDKNLNERMEALSQQVRLQGDQVVVNLSVYAQDRATSEETRSKQMFQVIGPAGNLVAGERRIPPPQLYDFPDPSKVKLRTVQIDGTDFRVAYTYKQGDAREAGDPQIMLQMAEAMDARNTLANEIVKGVIFPQFVILPISIWLVWFGLSRGLLPLKRLETRLRQRAPDDLSPVDLAGTPEEIMPLMRSFNELLARLGNNISNQKRFIADAAHQMKTPLAGLKTQAELALRQTNPAELRKSLVHVVQSSDRAAHLVSQLLTLARTENQQNRLEMGAVELSGLTQEVLQEMAPAAIAKAIDLGFEAYTGKLYVNGQALLLHELIHNLVDNALRYTPNKGMVTVRVRQEGDEVRLEVEDNGPGVPYEQRERIFDRFYQAPNAPNKISAQGSGLGLAIVAEIARQHQSRVWAEPGIERTALPEQGEHADRPAYGARFVLSLKRRMARVTDR
jgi:two-component system, OmpR family, sensor histidine kinase TctE